MLQLKPRRGGPGGHRSPGLRGRVFQKPAAALVVAVAALVPVQGCAGGTAAAPDAGADAGAARGGAAEGARPPAEPPIHRSLYGQGAVMRRIGAADHRLVAACMQRQGFAYRAAAPSDGAGEAPRPEPFGREREPSAAAAPSAGPSETPAADGRYARALFGDPARRVTARGARMTVSGPADGCIAEAKEKLLGADRQAWMRAQILLFEAEQDAQRDLAADTALRQAHARWRECVRAAGFDWPDPLRALADRTDRAVRADVGCKRRTGYLATAYAALAAAQERRLAAQPRLLGDWTAYLRKQELAARSVAPG